LLYLAIRNAGLRWSRPVEWTAAMGQFAILFGDRFETWHAEVSKRMNYGSPYTINRTFPSVLISGAVAALTTTPLVPLGDHVLRGTAAPCAVFTLPD
ncbi:MAG TPA: hypothetical protein VE687_08895, partial [Stellaceae bacterium]|nr:hypothetical protein [Stellaceae bacterium]